MIFRKWIGPFVAALAVLISLPTFADVTASGYDRMDGDYIRPNRRPAPKRNFNTTLSEGDRLNVYSVKRNSRTRVDASTGTVRTDKETENRILDQQNEPYSPDVNRVDPGTSPRSRYSRSDVELSEESAPIEDEMSEDSAEEGVATVEAQDVSTEDVSEAPVAPAINPETAMVFCSKSLYEYHWDRTCPMLKNVRPTPLTLLAARNSNYVECSVCRKKREQK